MTNAYQVYTAARQLLEGYAAAMQPLCRREGLAPNGVDILLFLANNPGLDTARDVCTYRGLKPGIVSFHVEKLLHEGKIGAVPANRNGRLPCEYCDYRSVCGREAEWPDRPVVKLEKAEIYEQLEGGQLAWQM